MENTYNFVSVKNKNVRYLGRWTVDSLARSYFQSGVEFYFTGKLAGVDVLCEGRDCALTVSVDNEKSFVVPGNTFDNVKGNFPIGFFMWNLSKKENIKDSIKCDVFD